LNELEKITVFNYDTRNADFLAYLTRRTGYIVGLGEFLAEDANENDARWRKITRAKIQNCWEVYSDHQRRTISNKRS